MIIYIALVLHSTRTRSGDTIVTGVEETGQAGLGFCPDFSPDKTVGVAMERLLVGSQDVAHDCSKLKELGVTHILNVAYSIPGPNAFTDVSMTYRIAGNFSEGFNLVAY